MSYRSLSVRRESAVEYLTLNRPDVRNALNEQLIAELSDWAVSQAARRHEVRAVVLAGAGTVGFDYRDLAKSANTVVDAGLGFESSIAVRDFDVILSVLYAHTVHAPSCPDPAPVGCRDLSGGKFRFSIRTIR